jgi:hypothetical protein
MFDLVPADQAFRFDTPVRVVEHLYDKQVRPACFGTGTHGTLFAVDGGDFAGMVQVMFEINPGQQQALRQWLDQAGWQDTTASVRQGRA